VSSATAATAAPKIPVTTRPDLIHAATADLPSDRPS
jgi:hypothetical protein